MPCNYKLYPKNWKTEIRPAILERAGLKCEACGVDNYAVGYRTLEGIFIDWMVIHDQLEDFGNDLFDNVLSHCFDKDGNPTKPLKIVLTIAHLDHDINNNQFSNLKALCQKCHLNHDAEHHRKNAQRTLKLRKKQIEIEF